MQNETVVWRPGDSQESPGVSVGMPLLACHDMQPMPAPKRSRFARRSFRSSW